MANLEDLVAKYRNVAPIPGRHDLFHPGPSARAFGDCGFPELAEIGVHLELPELALADFRFTDTDRLAEENVDVASMYPELFLRFSVRPFAAMDGQIICLSKLEPDHPDYGVYVIDYECGQPTMERVSGDLGSFIALRLLLLLVAFRSAPHDDLLADFSDVVRADPYADEPFWHSHLELSVEWSVEWEAEAADTDSQNASNQLRKDSLLAKLVARLGRRS